ncbi:transcription factor bHLH51-like [Salvia hispanica]|uniref:transcription factor bHLH51-like n=1 Tax=Salvia hispanica TaxID=49212 RepID=UPI002009AB09|nr:transcription factor bHLH51-like [Salvia hispanica]
MGLDLNLDRAALVVAARDPLEVVHPGKRGDVELAGDAVAIFPWLLPPAASADRAASASRSHSDAEKRRRDRINAQLSTLLKLIPKFEKIDKAALLRHVVDHVKEKRQRAKEARKISSGVPSKIEEVIVHQIDDRSEQIKESICCDDRPELFTEIGSALKALEATYTSTLTRIP